MDYKTINFDILTEKRKHPVLESVFAILALVFLLFVVVGIIRTYMDPTVGNAAIAFGSFMFCILFLKLSDVTSTPSVAMPNFIATNGFQPMPDIDVFNYSQGVALSGRLRNKSLAINKFRTGNAFTGNLSGHDFQAFELIRTDEDVIKSGQRNDLRPYMLIITYDLGRDVPHMYIANRRMTEVGGKAVGAFEEGWLLQQPGNFKAINKDQEKFVVYAPDKLEAEVLTLLNPSTLEILANAGGGCDIEFFDRHLLIYQYIGWMEERPKSYKTAFSLAAQFRPAIDTKLKTMRYSEADLGSKTKGIYHEN